MDAVGMGTKNLTHFFPRIGGGADDMRDSDNALMPASNSEVG